MNINKSLFKQINEYGHIYSCYSYEIERFLIGNLDFFERQEEAIKIIHDILAAHGKQELLSCLADLAVVETKIRELEPWIRDHVVHALLTLILGIYINEEFMKNVIGSPVNIFQWKLAGLLHDIGYPIEIAKGVGEPFGFTLNKLRRRFGAVGLVRFPVIPFGLESLSNNKNGLFLIQQQLDDWEVKIDAVREYSRMQREDKICHGMISSLALLNVIDSMYQHFNPGRCYETIYSSPNSDIDWNRKYFEEDIIPACSAIFIHNLPLRCFKNSKVDPLKAPLPFLLKLCDCLQDWERPSYKKQRGLPADLFNIQIQNDNILFFADVPKREKEKLRASVYNYLETQSVQII
ncbi:hypothetical protein ACFLUO_06975 [Chloroflexota bacterium]